MWIPPFLFRSSVLHLYYHDNMQGFVLQFELLDLKFYLSVILLCLKPITLASSIPELISLFQLIFSLLFQSNLMWKWIFFFIQISTILLFSHKSQLEIYEIYTSSLQRSYLFKLGLEMDWPRALKKSTRWYLNC